MAVALFEHHQLNEREAPLKFDYRRVEVLVGVDMAKKNHYAQAITATGEEVFHRSALNDQAAIEKLILDARRKGRVALMIDMRHRPRNCY
jgi:Transposase